MSAKQVGWKAQFNSTENTSIPYADALTKLGAAVDTGKNDGKWQVSAFFNMDKSPTDIEVAISLVATTMGEKKPTVNINPIHEENWQAKVMAEFPPLKIGSFFIHHFDEEIPKGMVELKIPAGMAFGTGEHATTSSCLALYEELTATYNFQNALDMGCGSGILAIAVAKKDSLKSLAIDIDTPSIDVAIENCTENNVINLVTPICGDGFNTPKVQQKAPYDLIFANILASPLISMSAELAKVTSTGGIAIISGFLTSQRDDVLAAYKAVGMELIDEVVQGEWVATAIIKNS